MKVKNSSLNSEVKMMYAKSLFFVLIFTVISGHASAERDAEAIGAATSWLQLIDSGKYKESYIETSSFFKTKVTDAQWEKSIKEARQPYGKLLNRKLKVTQHATTLPGAPDGQYIVIQFDASFEKRKEAVETITPTLDKDNKWRVSGYYIK